MEVFHYTPPEEELLQPRKISCTFPGCGSTFTNLGNLDFHMKRHHGKQPVKRLDVNGKECLFHCPQLNCPYSADHTSQMYFKTLKYLRQHYQKMHVAKTNVCDLCGKAFINTKQLKVHKEKMCGVKYVCKDCGWDYNTMEALLTHGKRKGHKVRDGRIIKAKQLSRWHVKGDQETQTEEPPPQKFIAECSILAENSKINTETIHSKIVPTNTALSNDIPVPRHIKTQTEAQVISSFRNSTFNASTPTMHSSFSSSQLLPPSTHTYTQTYDDLFADSLLGFTDIQTQTNWSSFSDVAADTTAAEGNRYNTPGAATCTRCSYDELLVSTETQTSFTQCLLESRATNGDTEDGTFGNLYQTQHTQTCDMLLGALFGAQESDLIGGYQSTYTQT